MKKILVIDDSNTNVILVEAVLQKYDYQVMVAYSATEARQLLKEETPDLILLDILMPEINGFSFLEQIKQDQRLMDIPVVILSAVNSQDYKQKAQNLGAIDYLTKPLDVDDITSRVKTCFND